jgi:hypothetical protein
MKKMVLRGLKSGLVFGLIFIFLILIGFVRVGASMLGSVLTNRTASEPVSLLLFISLLGLLAGFSLKNGVKGANWIETIAGGLSASLTGGLCAVAVVLAVGILSVNGTDFRTYLPNLGPEQVRFLLFSSTPSSAAQAYLLYFGLSCLLGTLIAKLTSEGQWLYRTFTGVQSAVSQR